MAYRKASYATTHAIIFIPGLGQIGDTFMDKPHQKGKASDMTLIENGVRLIYDGIEMLVPYTQFKVIVMVPEDKVVPIKK